MATPKRSSSKKLTKKSLSKRKEELTQFQEAPEANFLTAPEACKLLSVKPQTLYAYVSRGLLRAETRPGTTVHFYLRSELESLLARSRARSGHGATAASAMRWGEPILDSAITNIHNNMIFYRGFALNDLLRDHVGFENVAELLWSGELPSKQTTWPAESQNLRHSRTASQEVDSGLYVARRLIFRISEEALSDTNGRDELLDETLRRARHLILSLAIELFDININVSKGYKNRSIAEAIAESLNRGASPAAAAAVNAALIASADHELNASTFAARITASTGADLYSCMTAAMAAFSGRHHGLSPVDTYRFVKAAASDADPAKYISDFLNKGREIPGFGHHLYPNGDPRATILIEKARLMVEEIDGEGRQSQEFLTDLIKAAKKLGMQPPNLDLGLVAIARALGLPDVGASSLFVLGRMAGWTAHIIEQRQQGFLLRPRARYVGRAPLIGK